MGRRDIRNDWSTEGHGRRPAASRRPPRIPDEVENAPRSWGGVARRGGARVTEAGSASAAWRAANEAAREERRRPGAAGDDAPEASEWEPEEWIDEGEVRDEAQDAVRRGRAPRRAKPAPRRPRPPRPRDDDSVAPEMPAALAGGPDPDVAAAEQELAEADRELSLEEELRNALGAARAARAQQRMKEAGEAFRRGRFEEARKILRPLAESAPRAAALRELYGLTLYRLGRWKQAIAELEAFRTLTGSVEQHPVLADCYRALRRYDEVEALWEELSAVSPSGELVAEGRIVAAGALADQGRLKEALRLLEPGVRPARKAKVHHLRVAYALADLYERAGDLPRARELFQRVATSDPEFVDVQARLAALR
ncbi:MAG TPA: tetratricopeptide repeat protein [Acidimicrobiales bacterium]